MTLRGLLALGLGDAPADGARPAFRAAPGQCIALFLAFIGLSLAVGAPPALAAGPPRVAEVEVRNVTAVSAHLDADVNAGGSVTHWRFEYAPSASGPWSLVPGATGTISQADAEAMVVGASVGGLVTGLKLATTYYVRLFAENECASGCGEGVNGYGEPISMATRGLGSFETLGPPIASTFLEHALDGESIRIFGSIDPHSVPTSDEQMITIEGAPTGGTFALTFDGHSTGATGSGDVAGGGATGNGYISMAEGRGLATRGSNIITDVNTTSGVFAVGETMLNPSGTEAPIPENTKITAVGAGTLTLSANAIFSTSDSFRLQAESTTITDVNTFTGAFAVGQSLAGGTIPQGTVVIAVGPGTLTISGLPSTFGDISSGVVALTATNDAVANLTTSTGWFVRGEAISGPGIPPGTTITGAGTTLAGTGVLTLSADTTAAGTGVALAADLPYDAAAETVGKALGELPGEPSLGVEGPAGGPYTVFFKGPNGGVSQPQIEGDALGLTPFGTIAVATTQQGGEASDTHYHFQYVSQEKFAAGGWAEATETPAVDLGSGNSPVDVSEDAPGLQAGETYHYRVVATSDLPGNPAIAGEEQTLLVPSPAAVEEVGACPNARFRTGASANLPDCRAYEQVTPVDKEDATEIFKPEFPHLNGGTLYGEDGDHFMVEAASTKWGSAPGSGQGPYFFTRDPQTGWQMTAATPQPEAGVKRSEMQLVNPDLTAIALESFWSTGRASSGSFLASETAEFKTGPPGGPYTTISIPTKDEGEWVAASEDFSKLIVRTQDRGLMAGHPSATKHGFDLYEVSGGEVRQLNVLTGGAVIGTCGARMVDGKESVRSVSSRYAVSADGSRVFFEAQPGSKCESEPMNLYVRVGDTETVDIGPYKFLAGDAAGSRMLLENGLGEIFMYETESGSAKHLATTAERTGAEEQLGLVARYSYFEASEHLGFRPGGTELPWVEDHGVGGYQRIEPGGGFATQLWRYDRVEHLFECISCASPFNPHPRLSVSEGGADGAVEETKDGVPSHADFTANGDYAFFETPAALVPRDVNGEVHKEPENAPFEETACGGERCLFPERPNGSPSNDIYEWTKDGIQGCARIQGCLNLITPGKDGYMVELVGTTPSGHDVFFYTSSQLVPGDDDSAGDIYDARIDGGFAEPARPVECEGDSCSTPFAAPNDLTPASATFHGAGDVSSGTPPQAKPKPKRKAAKKKARKKKARTRTKRAGGLRRDVGAARHTDKSDHGRGK